MFSACTQPPAAQDTTLFCMDTVMQLRIYGDDGTAAQTLDGLLRGLDGALSVTNEAGALYALNRTGESGDADVLALWDAASALCARTHGAVDPTLYPAVKLWGFTTGEYRVPAQSALDEALTHIGADKAQLANGVLTLERGMALDFGAFAKGYAADRCREALEQRGLAAILTLGGNIQTVGSKPDGSDWVVGIADPGAPDNYCLTLHIRGSRAVVTSGDYQRYFEQDGVRYCHILDPATARPVQNGLRSVTVVCDSGVTADGLSTALFVMGFEEAVEFWRQSDDFEAVFIERSGTVSVTEGLAEAVGSGAAEVIKR